MAKYGSNSIVIEVDNASNSLVDLSQYITAINGVSKEVLTEESTTFGDTWEEHLSAVIKRMEPIELDGFYDDTATTGPHVILDSLGDTRTFKITWGGSKTTSVETILKKYQRMAQVKGLTKFKATLQPTGAPTEA